MADEIVKDDGRTGTEAIDLRSESVRYLGDGSAYVEGVPARDLTREEWDRLRPDLRALAIATGLYFDPTGEAKAPPVEVATIDLRDGASDAEANVAARTLNERRKAKE